MKTFQIKYGFDIKNKKNEFELVYWERGSFEIEAVSRASIDSLVIQQTVKKMAQDACKNKGDYVMYANFHGIEELKELV